MAEPLLLEEITFYEICHRDCKKSFLIATDGLFLPRFLAPKSAKPDGHFVRPIPSPD
jgi:hypothetical protein